MSGRTGPLQPGPPFFLASIDKLLNATIAMKLSEQRQLDLDTRISAYLPPALTHGLHRLDGIDYSDRITVRHLLGHTSAEGEKAAISKPLKGLGSGVFEVALKYRTDTFRTVYALQLARDVWVLHAFQKKAKTGIKTPKMELELIRERLKRLKRELRQ